MKKIKYITLLLMLLAFTIACDKDFSDTDFIKSDVAPTDVSATFKVTQDNTGMVSITPTATGVMSYKIYLGDSTQEPVKLKVGETAMHKYAEGNYQVKVVAISPTGKQTEANIPLQITFKAPENLDISIENDKAISKKVNISVNADYAVNYEVDYGDTSTPTTVNIGEGTSYVYEQPGTYTITIVVKGAAVQTTTYKKAIEVKVLQQPTALAPTPPRRKATDVISIFSNAYENIAGINYNPDWGQGGQGSSFADFSLNDNQMLQFIKLSYQGIEFGQEIDITEMEYIHLDVWTADVNTIETSLISASNGEKPVVKELTKDAWTSIDIPISAFTEQGLTVADIHQLKFVGNPWAGGTVFVDNIYFYKEPSSGLPPVMINNFERDLPTFTEFGGASVEVIDNPDATGENTTAKVTKLVKEEGAEVWAGAFFNISPLDLNNYSKIAMKVWSPKANAVVKVKLENADGSITHEIDMNTTTSNAWEELVYDFSTAPQADYVKFVVFFDFGNAGDNSTYYYDEIQLTNGQTNTAEPILFEGFEGDLPTFTEFGGASIEVIDNPDATGKNTTAKVVKLVKGNGAEVWAGAFFEKSIDISTYKKISIKVWSPKANAIVKVKLENADASVTHEVDMNTTTSNAWEELVYDFSTAPQADYVKFVVFFDFGNGGDESTYYYDDILLME